MYRDVLPSIPQDSGSVTFTISNTVPPRTSLSFPKIPVGVVGRSQNVNVNDGRKYVGDLVYSVSSSKRQATGNNSRQYEIGQVLEFNSELGATVEPMLVNQTTEIQHNTNLPDYAALGLSAEEQEIIASESARVYSTLTDQLSAVKRQRADTEVVINTQQKLINEINRAIAALEIIASAEVADLIVKFKLKLSQAFAIRDAAVMQANLCAGQADELLARLRSVAMVVK